MNANKIKVNIWFTITLITISLFSPACDDFSFHNGIDEGVIEYSISYPDIPSDSYILDLMPKKMQTSFKDDNFRSDIIAGMGLFKTSIISIEKDKELLHSVKMLNKKYASKLSSNDLIKLNPDFENIEIELIDERKEIAGYHCKAAEVKVLADSTWSFKLYYTNEIKIKNVNLHTPFKEINGVLMEYEVTSYDTHMHFIADKVIQKEVNESEIKLEEGYKMIAPLELKKEIESIFAKVR